MKDVGHSLCRSVIQCANKCTSIAMKPKINMYNRFHMHGNIYIHTNTFICFPNVLQRISTSHYTYANVIHCSDKTQTDESITGRQAVMQMGEHSPFACRARCPHLTLYWTRCTWRTWCTALKRHVLRLSSVTTLRRMTSSKLPPLITAVDA